MVLVVTCWHIWEALAMISGQWCVASPDIRNNDVQLHPLRVAAKSLANIEMIPTHLFKDKTTVSKLAGPLVGLLHQVWFVLTLIQHCSLWSLHGMRGSVEGSQWSVYPLHQRRIWGLPLPELAEALVVRHALTVSRDYGIRKVVMVSDFLSPWFSVETAQFWARW